MFERVIFVDAVLTLVFMGGALLLKPNLIGQAREPYSMWNWFADVLLIAAVVPLCGRALRWW